MYRELEKTTDRMIGWFMKKVLDALWAVFWMLVGVAVVHGIPALVRLLKLFLNALSSFTRWLISAFERRTAISITHSPILTFLAWIVVWGLVILPVGAVFLAGLGTLVGLLNPPGAEETTIAMVVTVAIPFIIGIGIGTMMSTEGRGRGDDVKWSGRAHFSGADFDGGLKVGEEVTWY